MVTLCCALVRLSVHSNDILVHAVLCLADSQCGASHECTGLPSLGKLAPVKVVRVPVHILHRWSHPVPLQGHKAVVGTDPHFLSGDGLCFAVIFLTGSS